MSALSPQLRLGKAALCYRGQIEPLLQVQYGPETTVSTSLNTSSSLALRISLFKCSFDLELTFT
jgi:hypothetical protein